MRKPQRADGRARDRSCFSQQEYCGPSGQGRGRGDFRSGLVRNSRFTYWSAVDDNNRPQLIDFA